LFFVESRLIFGSKLKREILQRRLAFSLHKDEMFALGIHYFSFLYGQV
jgi:hypothetical protein